MTRKPARNMMVFPVLDPSFFGLAACQKIAPGHNQGKASRLLQFKGMVDNQREPRINEPGASCRQIAVNYGRMFSIVEIQNE